MNQLIKHKAPGPDGLHPRILKETATEIAKPVLSIFRATVETGKLPAIWKRATVSPKLKGEKDLAKNYRPISLTCIRCKVLETIIRENTINHLRTNDILSPKQFGFLDGRSTQLQMLITTELWQQALDEGRIQHRHTIHTWTTRQLSTPSQQEDSFQKSIP
jgi:hypothetical protein